MIVAAEVLAPGRLLPLKPTTDRGYRPCNPGVLRVGDGYLVVCRTVRFSRSRSRSAAGDPRELIRSRNVMMRLNRRLETVDERRLTTDEPPLRRGAIQGLEDCRLFSVRGTPFVTCTTADRHPSGQLHMSVCRLDGAGRVVAHRPLVGPFDDRPQKNWLPFADSRGIVRAFYSYDPLTIVRLCVESGRYDVEKEVPHRWGGAAWRGSAGPVSLPGSGKLLILVHEVVSRQANDPRLERIYLHRFVECDTSFSITRVSRPFVFTHYGIEFPCGMTLTHDSRSLIIGLGVQDRRAYLCCVSVAAVLEFLRSSPPTSSIVPELSRAADR